MSQGPLSFDADALAEALDHLNGPVHLPSLTALERERTMAELREWVTQLVRRFTIEPRVLPPCWEQHNGMVEALLALRDHERGCYAETASPTAGVEWFHAFREIEARILSLGAMTRCTAQEHRTSHLATWS